MPPLFKNRMAQMCVMFKTDKLSFLISQMEGLCGWLVEDLFQEKGIKGVMRTKKK